MAKSVDLTKVHVRNKLSATSSDPVPYPLAKGQHLLYRPSSRSWGLRWISSDGKRQFKWFGTLPDTPEHAKFDLARELAKATSRRLAALAISAGRPTRYYMPSMTISSTWRLRVAKVAAASPRC
jgi:hypothetical protein